MIAAESAPLRLLEEDVGGAFGESSRRSARRACRCAAARRRTHARHLSACFGSLNLRLGRKRVAVQPLEQIAAVRADHLQLRRVQMRVDESRRDEDVVAELRQRRALPRDVAPRADAGDAIAVDGEIAVVVIDIRLRRIDREWISNRREDPAAKQSSRAHSTHGVTRRTESLPLPRPAARASPARPPGACP